MLSFDADAVVSTGTVTIAAVDDEEDTADKQVRVTGAVSNAEVRAPEAVTLTIADDDLPEVTIAALTSEVTEGTAAEFELTRAGVTSAELAVAVSVSESGTMLAETPPTQATFAAGSAKATLTVQTDGDEADEEASTITVQVTAEDAVYRLGTDDTATVTVADDDPPTVELVLTPARIEERDDAGTAEQDESVSVVTARVALAAGEPFAVTVGAAAVEPAQDTDFMLSTNKVLSFAANATESTGTVTIAAVDDERDTADKRVMVTGVVTEATVANAPAPVELTIGDDDLPLVTIAALTSEVTEGTAAEFELTRAGVTSAELAVAVSVSETGAMLAESPPAQATFAAGSATASLTVQTVRDDEDEADSTITAAVTVGVDAAYRLGTEDTATVKVADDDLPTVELVLTPARIEESGGESVVTARVALAAEEPFAVTVGAAAVEPAQDTDFMLSTNPALSFAANATESTGTVTITAVNDNTDTADKRVMVTGVVTEATVANAPAPVELTIGDDDLPEVTIAAVTSEVTEGTAAEFELMRAGVTSAALTVTVTVTHEGSVIANPDDYVEPLSLSFGADDDALTLTVATQADTSDEPDGAITAQVSTDANYRVGSTAATVTVMDDDYAYTNTTLTPSPADPTVPVASTATYDIDFKGLWTIDVTPDGVPGGAEFDGLIGAVHGSGVFLIQAGATASAGVARLAEAGVNIILEREMEAVGLEAFEGDDDIAATGMATMTGVTFTTGQPRVTLLASIEPTPDWFVGVAGLSLLDPSGQWVETREVDLYPWDAGYRDGGDFKPGPVNAETDPQGTITSLRGLGQFSDQAIARLTFTRQSVVTAPAAPTGVAASAADGEVALSWDTPAAEASIERHEYRYRAGSDAHWPDTWTPIPDSAPGGANEDRYTVPDLSNGVTYRFQVRAVNAGGNSVTADATASAIPRSQVTLVLTPARIEEQDNADTSGTDESVSVVTATLQKAHATAFTVTVGAAAVDPAQDTDFTLSTNQVLSFAANATASTGVVTVTAEDNADEDGNKRVRVTGTVTDSTAALAPAGVELVIVDDEGLPKVTLVLKPATIGERDDPGTSGTDEAESVVTATLQEAHSAAFTVTVSAAAVSPAEDTDFMLSTNKVLSFAADAVASTGTVTIAAVDDEEDTADKQVRVTGAVSDTVVRAPEAVTLTIADDDLPEVTIAALTSEVTEGTAAQFELMRAGVTSGALAVAVSVSETGEMIAGAPPTQVSFGAGSAKATLAVATDGDEADEPDSTITAEVAAADAVYRLGTDDTATVTVADDDLPTVELVLTPARIEESGGESVVTARVALAAEEPFAVTVGAAAVEPAQDTDFMLSTNPALSFAANATESTGTVTIAAVNDNTDTADKRVMVTGVVTEATVANAPAPVELTIGDDDLPEVTIAALTSEVTEGAPAEFELTRAGVTSASLAVAVSVSESGAMIAGTKPTQVSFAAGSATATLAVQTVGDAADEEASTITAQVTAAADAVYRLGTEDTATATVTVADDDLPEVTIAAVTSEVTEGTAAEFELTREGVTSGTLTVAVSVSETGAMIAGTPPRQVSFGAGSATATLAVATAGDEADEEASTITAQVTAAADAVYRVGTGGSATVTVADDDLPEVTIAAVTAEVTEGTAAEFELMRAGVTSGALTVAVSVSETGAMIAGAPPTQATFGAGSATASLTVQTDGDDEDEPDSTITAEVTAADAVYRLGTDDTATVTVADDDLPTVELVLTPEEIDERDGESVVTARVALAAGKAFTVTVGVTVVNPVQDTDFMLSTNRVLSFAADATASTGVVKVTAVNNADEDGDKRVTVTGTVTDSTAALAPAGVELVIVDDEGLPKVTLVLEPATIEEQDNPGTSGTDEAESVVTATLQKAHATAFAVTVGAAAVPPAESGNFMLSTNPVLSFAADAVASTGTVTIAAVNDEEDTADKQVEVTATVSDADVRAPGAVTLTIADDDLPVVTIAAVTSAVTEGAPAEFELTRAGVTSASLAVAVSVSESGAMIAGTPPTQVSFAAGSATATLAVQTVGDAADEEASTITAQVTAAADAVYRLGTEDTATVTVADDDLPEVTIAAVTSEVTEGTAAEFELTREGVTSGTLTVAVSVSETGAMLAGTPPRQVSFGAGSATATLAVATAGDEADEEASTITAQVTAAADAVYRVGTGGSATVTVADDDLPEVTIAAVTAEVTEGTAAEFELMRAGVTSAELTVAVSVSETGAMIAGAPPTQATFGAGSATASLTVQTDGDDEDEPDSTITAEVTAADAVYRLGTDDTATVTVADDDLPTVELVLTPARIEEQDDEETAGQDESVSVVTARVALAAGEAFAVTVGAAAVDPAQDTDFMLSTNPVLSFAADAVESTGTVTITAVDDERDTAEKLVRVTGVVTEATVANAPAPVELTIADDDLPEVTIAAVTAEVTEGAPAQFELTRAGVTSGALAVAVSVSESGAMIAGTPPTQVSFAAGSAKATLTVATDGDEADEPDSTITAEVTAADAVYRLGTEDTAEVTVADDDLPTVELVLMPEEIDERDGESVVTARVALAAGKAFTVTVGVTVVNPVQDTDFTLSTNKVLSFAADAVASTGVVTVTAEDNADEDGDKRVTVTGTVTDSTAALAPAGVELVIVDDEGLPKVTLVLEPARIEEQDDAATGEVNEALSVVTATLQKAHSAAFTVTVSAAAVSRAESRDFTLSTNRVLSFAADATASKGTASAAAVSPAESGDFTLSTNRVLSFAADATAFAVTVSAAAVPPAESGDFMLSTNRVLSFAADATASTGTVTIAAVNDEEDTADKQVEVTATVSDADVRAPGAVTLTIADDDLPVVTIAAVTSAVTEGAPAEFELTRAGVTSASLTVAVSVSESGAMIAGTKPTQVSFAAGSATATLAVQTVGDAADEEAICRRRWRCRRSGTRRTRRPARSRRR